MALITITVVADTSGNSVADLTNPPPAPGSPVTVITAAAVNIQGVAGAAAAGFTLPPNVPVALPLGGQKVYLKAPSATSAVSFMYVT